MDNDMTNNSSREDSPKVASSFGDRNIDSSELASMINTESRPFTEPFNIDNGINPEDEQSASNEAIEPTLDTIDNDNTDKMFSDSNIETTETSQNNEEDGRKEVESNDKIPIEQEEEKEEEYQNYDDVMKVDAEALAKKELEAKAAAQALENANSLKKASSPEPEDDEEEAEYAEYKYDGFHSDIINSDLTKWSGKKYMGGYKDKRTNTEYFHAITQTITAHEIRAARANPRNHRDTQTKEIHNRIVQSTVDNSTQMTKIGLYVSQGGDIIRIPKKYVTSEEHEAFILETILKIQCFLRRCIASKLVEKKRNEKRTRSLAMAGREKMRRELAEKRRKNEIESRLHPKSTKDFEILYNGLENWRIQEAKKINEAGFSEPARLTALADLLDQEAALIQKIDRLKITALEENRETGIANLLDKMASPKKWMINGPKGGVCHVDTPNTIRARELRDLYHALNIPLLSVDERLQILLHVKYTVKEFDCTLTRDIVELIDREGDLVSRGRDAKSLEGLRKRTSNLFLQFIQTPEFNPESKVYQKFPNAGQSWKREQAVYYCRGCTKYLPSTEFYLSTTLRNLGKCKECTMKENIANQRKDDTSYVEILKMARGQEGNKEIKRSAREIQFNAISLLQESDVRYLVDTIWNRQSAVSGNKNIEELVLTRWQQSQELSPWNVILLTHAEASNHDKQSNPFSVYSDEFIARVQQKHLAAKQHFEQLPAMEKYLKKQYLESGGRLSSKKNSLPSLAKKEDFASDLSISGNPIQNRI